VKILLDIAKVCKLGYLLTLLLIYLLPVNLKISAVDFVEDDQLMCLKRGMCRDLYLALDIDL